MAASFGQASPALTMLMETAISCALARRWQVMLSKKLARHACRGIDCSEKKAGTLPRAGFFYKIFLGFLPEVKSPKRL